MVFGGKKFNVKAENIKEFFWSQSFNSGRKLERSNLLKESIRGYRVKSFVPHPKLKLLL